MVLLNEFNFARPPCLVEPGFQRGVEAKDEHEAFIRYRLYPVFLLTFGCFGAEVDIKRSISVLFNATAFAVEAGVRIVGLQH